MGVAGSGTTTIGKRLAAGLELPFHDADDFHAEANIRKMAAGRPLYDNDGKPWLEILGKQIKGVEPRRGSRAGLFGFERSVSQEIGHPSRIRTELATAGRFS